MSNEEGYYWDSIKEQWSHVDEPEDDMTDDGQRQYIQELLTRIEDADKRIAELEWELDMLAQNYASQSRLVAELTPKECPF